MAKFATVEEYIGSFPPDVQRTLESVRAAIRAAVPGTEERISYDIPTFALDGKYVVYFSGWKRHVSVYPIPDADPALERELKPHMAGKADAQVPAHGADAAGPDRQGRGTPAPAAKSQGPLTNRSAGRVPAKLALAGRSRAPCHPVPPIYPRGTIVAVATIDATSRDLTWRWPECPAQRPRRKRTTGRKA